MAVFELLTFPNLISRKILSGNKILKFPHCEMPPKKFWEIENPLKALLENIKQHNKYRILNLGSRFSKNWSFEIGLSRFGSL